MKKIIVNNEVCVIQSYLENDYVNLCPVQDARLTPFTNVLGNIRILFYSNKIVTEGKETQYWKEFIKGIDVESVKNQLRGMF